VHNPQRVRGERIKGCLKKTPADAAHTSHPLELSA